MYCDNGLSDFLFVVLGVLIAGGFLVMIIGVTIEAYESHIKRIKRASHQPVIDKEYHLSADPDLVFTVTEINSEDGEVTVDLTIMVPAGVTILNSDTRDTSNMLVVYREDGAVHSVKYDASGTPIGLDGWDILINLDIMVEKATE